MKSTRGIFLNICKPFPDFQLSHVARIKVSSLLLTAIFFLVNIGHSTITTINYAGPNPNPTPAVYGTTYSKTDLNEGFVLSSYTLYKQNQPNRFFSGVELVFSDQFSTTTSSQLIGSTYNNNSVSYNAYNQTVNGKQIAKAFICNEYNIPNNYTSQARTLGLWFYYFDGTVVKNPPDSTQYLCNSTISYYLPQSGSLSGMIRGLSFFRSTCGLTSPEFCMDLSLWSINVDTETCSITKIPTQTINTMDIVVFGIQQTLNFSGFQSNSVAAAANNPTLCGTSYTMSISPAQTFLTLASTTLTGQTNSPSDVGTYFITLIVQLQPYEYFTQVFTVNVSCTISAPNCTPTSVTVEIGITTQPYTIPFTQAQTCGVSATLSTVPDGTGSWLSLISNTASGGGIQVNGATLSQVNTYALTLTNTFLSQTQTDTLTLIIKDPCSRAVFETNPSPFSTITVTFPSSTSVDTTFKVFTDVERLYSSIICPISATITTGYGPVSLLTSPATQVRVNSSLVSLPTDIGAHAITLQIASSNYSGSVTAVNFTFNVVISCTVTSLTIEKDTSVQDFVYLLGAGEITQGTFTPAQVSDCQYSVAWTNTQYSDSNLVGPATNFDPSSLTFTFSFTDTALIGTVQKYVLRATISQNDPNTGQPMFAETNISVTIRPDCPSSKLVTKTFNDMSINVGASATQDIQFQDSVANQYSLPTICGPRAYNFDGGLPSYLQIDNSATTLTLSTSNPSFVGTHDISFEVSLFDYPEVTSLIISFKVTITCVVQSITFSIRPANILIEPGVTFGITKQPVTKSFSINQNPSCGSASTFSFVSAPPSFVSITNTVTNAGDILVQGAVLADQNVYALTLRAQVDSIKINENFQVEIKDPCSRAIFPTASPLTAMVLIRDFDSTKTQTVVASTDIQVNHSPLVCGFVASLVSPPLYVSISGTTITADASLTSASDVGSHTISVLVKSQLYSSTVTDVTYTFTLDVQHCVVNTLTIPAISNLSYTINQGPTTLTFDPATWSNLACLLSATYTTTYDSSSTLPAWLTFNESTRTFMINSTSQADVGIHTLTVTATIPQQSGGSTKQDTTSFNLTIINDCVNTSFVSRAISDMVTRVSQTAATQNIFIEDTKGQVKNNAAYCSARLYTITPTKAFITIAGDFVTVQSTSPVDVGTYNLSLQVTLQDFPLVTAFVATFSATIECEVLAISFSAAPTNIVAEPGVTSGITQQPVTKSFSIIQTPNCGHAQTFSFVLTPPLFVSITNVITNGGDIVVSGAVLADKNVYALTLRAQVDSAFFDANFQVEIKDPCSRAIFPTASPLAAMIMIRDFDSTKTQTVVATTDIQATHSPLVCGFVASLVSPPSYVSISGTTITADASLTSASDVGSHTISVLVKSQIYSSTVTDVTYTFTLDVQHCVVNTLTIPAISNLSYTINQGPTTLTFDPATWSNLACLLSATYTATYDSSSTLPAWLTFNESTRTFMINATSQTNVGNHTLTVTATIPQQSGGSTKQDTTSFNLTIINDCVNTSFVSRAITDMVTRVSQTAATQNIFIEDTKGQVKNNAAYCGARVYTITPTKAFITIAGDFVTVQSTSPVDVGTYNLSLQVTLQDFPLVTTFLVSFSATIECEVVAISFSTPPVNIVAEPGVTLGLTMQPVTKSFVITQTPNCGNPQTFSFVSTQPLFVTITNQASNVGDIVVSGAVLADKNVYALILRAQVDSALFDANFQVEIKDPCSRAIFPTASPLAAMIMIRDFDSTKTQTVVATTDIQATHSPLVCGFVASLVSPPSYVSISGTTITADASLTSASDAGSHTISVLVKSQLYPSTVSDVTYTFTLDVQHCVVNTLTIPAISNLSYTINQGPTTLTFDPATWSNLACLLSATYTVTYDSSSTLPAWLTFNGSTRTFMINATSQADVGIHVLTVTATIPQQSGGSTKQDTTSFNLTIINDCVNTSFVSRAISDMVTRVSQTAATQNIFIEDTKGQRYNNAAYCGPRLYTITPTKAFITIAGDVVTVQSTSPVDVGTYNLSLQVTLQDFPLVTAFVAAFSANIECEVLSIQVTQSPPESSKYRILLDTPLSLPFLFSESPKCGLVYSLSKALPFLTVFSSNNTMMVASSDLHMGGIYDLSLVASPPQFGVTQSVPFRLEMINICESTKFFSQTIADMSLSKLDPDFKPLQTIRYEPYKYEALEVSKVDCGPVKIKLMVFNSTDSPPDWIQVGDSLLSLDFSKLSNPSSVKLNLVAYLDQYPGRNITTSFSVSLSDSKLSCMSSAPQKFNLGQPPLQFGINYKNETSTFGLTLTPFIKPVAYDEQGSERPLPGFVNFNTKTSQFLVKDITATDFGNIYLGIQLGYNQYPSFAVVCKTKLTLTYTASFKGEPIAQTQLICGKPWSVHIPDYTDSFGQPTQTVVNLGEAKSFLTYEASIRNITTGDFDTSTLESGSFTVEITNTDSLAGSETQKVKFDILCFKGLTEVPRDIPKWVPSNLPQLSPPKPFIMSINQIGQVRVGFTKPILLPTFALYPEFLNEKIMRQNCTNTNISEKLCIKPGNNRRMLASKLDQETKEAVEIVNRGLVLVNETLWPILNLTMKAGIESNQSQLEMAWRCEDFKPLYMDFLVNYSQFQNVSIHDYKDWLEIKIYGYQYFRSADNNEYIEPTLSVMQRTVPLQLDPLGSKNLLLATQAVGNVSKAVIVFNFFVNLLLGGAIQQLFSAIRKLTIMVHLLIINVKIPANAQTFFGVLLNFVTFNLIDIEPYIRSGLKLYDTEDIDENFRNLGYVSNFFIINMGNVFIVLVYLIALLIFYAATLSVKNERFLRLRTFLTKGLIWNTIISFLTETYILIAISSITNFHIFKFTSLGTVLSLNFAMVGAMVLIGFPIFVLVFLQRKGNKLHLPKYRERYGKLYEELNYKREGKKALLEPFFSLVRILVLTLTLVLLKDYRYFQLFVSNFWMTFMVIYVGMTNCYALPSKRFFEQFNEVFVAITNYHLMCFADFVQDERTRNIVGWSMIGCVSLNLFINIGFIMIGVIKDSYFKLRKRYYERKLRLLKKRMAQRRAEFIAEIAAPENQDRAHQQVQQVFSKRPRGFEIDAAFSSEEDREAESSIANLVGSESNPPSVTVVSSNSLTKPQLLPGQIEYKSRRQDNSLPLKQKQKAHPMVNQEDLEEEKVPQARPDKQEAIRDQATFIKQIKTADLIDLSRRKTQVKSTQPQTNIDRVLEKMKQTQREQTNIDRVLEQVKRQHATRNPGQLLSTIAPNDKLSVVQRTNRSNSDLDLKLNQREKSYNVSSFIIENPNPKSWLKPKSEINEQLSSAFGDHAPKKEASQDKVVSNQSDYEPFYRVWLRSPQKR